MYKSYEGVKSNAGSDLHINPAPPRRGLNQTSPKSVPTALDVLKHHPSPESGLFNRGGISKLAQEAVWHTVIRNIVAVHKCSTKPQLISHA